VAIGYLIVAGVLSRQNYPEMMASAEPAVAED